MRFRLFVFLITGQMLVEYKGLLAANLLVAAILTGLIWTIQVVHYPAFRYVGTAHFIEFQHRHMRNISYLVIPLMLIEVILGIWLQWNTRGKDAAIEVASVNGLLFLIWLVTFAVSSPIHSQLATQGFDLALINKLISTNWIRTLAWTCRTGILAIIMVRV